MFSAVYRKTPFPPSRHPARISNFTTPSRSDTWARSCSRDRAMSEVSAETVTAAQPLTGILWLMVRMLEDFSKSKNTRNMQEAAQFVKQKIDSAKWFIDAINQRQNTLYVTMKAIVEIQKEYFLTGDETKLKPMILKDVADKVGLDISTISRVANSKYVQTPYGTFMLKYFFSEGITNNEGEEVSTREIKKILKDSVDNEDKANPMTDEQLMLVLKEKGYPIARRTVAKYREQLGIPVGRMRKKI